MSFGGEPPRPDKAATPEGVVERNHQILAGVKPENLARSESPFTGGTHFMHPNDVVRVVEKLKALDTEFENEEHSKGNVDLFGKKIYWQIGPDDNQPRVRISEQEF